MILKSPNFVYQGDISKTFTCDGYDSSSALSESGAPLHTKSRVLIVDDPDAPDPAKLGNIHHDSDTMTDIKNALNAGKEVITDYPAKSGRALKMVF
ncbi:MAG: hypothetical protein EPN17_18135 [Methylobacter sp.]|nr:MAG: hypothetical protein EPN17_18135 [Methylobacter sp.]